jgi:hypothetical protein
MTTIGKILVFMVFVAALGMGGLMVFVARTAPNWKAAVDERDKDVIPAFKAMVQQEAESRKKLIGENEKIKKLLENRIVESDAAMTKLKQANEALGEQAKAANQQQEVAQTNAAKAAAEAKRLEKEMEFMQNVLTDRQKTIVKLQDDLAQARNAEQAAKNEAVTATARAQSLYEQLKEKDRAMAAQMKNGQQGTPSSSGPRDATYTNPPPVFVKGRIEEVNDADKSLVKISIGSDSGIRKDHTLEVFRLSPKQEYLGRMVVVDADLHHAIGRLLRQPGMPTAGLQPGDQVASSIRP